MGAIRIGRPGQSLDDLVTEFLAEEWDRAYRCNFTVCQTVADEKGAGPSRITRKEMERREYERLFGADE